MRTIMFMVFGLMVLFLVMFIGETIIKTIVRYLQSRKTATYSLWEVDTRKSDVLHGTVEEMEAMMEAQGALEYMHDEQSPSYYDVQFQEPPSDSMLHPLQMSQPSLRSESMEDRFEFDDATEHIPVTAPQQDATQEWQSYVSLHEELNEKLWNAETDWDTIFFYPAINDHTVPETQDMFMAQVVAQRTSATPPTDLTSSTLVADLPYPKAVLALQKAWNIAWANAQKIAQSNLTDDERKTIDQIVVLLQKVQDGASTESEQQVAYERVDVLLKQLRNVTVPERTRALLAAERRQAIEASTVDPAQNIAQYVNSQREHEGVA